MLFIYYFNNKIAVLNIMDSQEDMLERHLVRLNSEFMSPINNKDAADDLDRHVQVNLSYVEDF